MLVVETCPGWYGTSSTAWYLSECESHIVTMWWYGVDWWCCKWCVVEVWLMLYNAISSCQKDNADVKAIYILSFSPFNFFRFLQISPTLQNSIPQLKRSSIGFCWPILLVAREPITATRCSRNVHLNYDFPSASASPAVMQTLIIFLL